MVSEPDVDWKDEFASALVASLSSFLSSHVDRDSQGSQLQISPLRTVQRLDSEELLSVLNFKDGSAQEPKEGLLSRMNRISMRLRCWIDEWLDSGRSADGVECSRSRNYESAKAVGEAVYKYSTRGKMHLLGTRDGLELWFDLQGEKAPLASEGFPLAIYIETVASEKLVLFLLSDLSYKLAKCREVGCGRYFFLKQWNRTYKNGTLCDKHQRTRNLKSAMKATAVERDNVKKELYRLTAQKFTKEITDAPGRPIDPALKEMIALYLNAEIRGSESLQAVYREGVTGKWLANAKNWNPIVSCARQLNKRASRGR